MWTLMLLGESDATTADDEEAEILWQVQALVAAIRARGVSGVTGTFSGQHAGTVDLGVFVEPGATSTSPIEPPLTGAAPLPPSSSTGDASGGASATGNGSARTIGAVEHVPSDLPPAPAGAGLEVHVVAHVAHEANRALQIEQADPTILVSPHWEDESDETRASAEAGVTMILADPTVTPRDSHEGWATFKRERGWVLGPVKDEATKQHPLLVPYDELPPAQRVKDALFFAIAKTLG